eukprot:10441359-Lingulodinium_polyedra.AAC.1
MMNSLPTARPHGANNSGKGNKSLAARGGALGRNALVCCLAASVARNPKPAGGRPTMSQNGY